MRKVKSSEGSSKFQELGKVQTNQPTFFTTDPSKDWRKRARAMALRDVYEGVYERPTRNYSACYQSQYRDYETFYNPLSCLFSLPSLSSPFFFLPFFVFIVTTVKERFEEVARVFVKLPQTRLLFFFNSE